MCCQSIAVMNSFAEPGANRTGNVRPVLFAARIITALAGHPHPMGVVELAARVKLSLANAHRMLADGKLLLA
jgi:hypothetical protein